MVKWYVNRIINNKMTLDQVPIKWKEQVEKMLSGKV